ncbi:ADP-ribosylation factor-binding protein GGA3a [Aulostomus maculatus]
MKNCGRRFHNEVGKFRFLNELIKVVSPKYLGDKVSEKVKTKVIEMIFSWTVSLPDEAKICEAYQMLKTQGIVLVDPKIPLNATLIPSPSPRPKNPVFDDEEKSRRLAELLKSKRPGDLQEANRLIKNMVKEDEVRTQKEMKQKSTMEAVNNSVKLLSEMLAYFSPEDSSDSDKDLIKELYGDCDKLRQTVFQLATETEDNDSNLGDILQASDDLSHVINSYKKIVEGQTINGETKEAQQTQSSVKQGTSCPPQSESLIDLMGLDVQSPSAPGQQPLASSMSVPGDLLCGSAASEPQSARFNNPCAALTLLDEELLSLGLNEPVSSTSDISAHTNLNNYLQSLQNSNQDLDLFNIASPPVPAFSTSSLFQHPHSVTRPAVSPTQHSAPSSYQSFPGPVFPTPSLLTQSSSMTPVTVPQSSVSSVLTSTAPVAPPPSYSMALACPVVPPATVQTESSLSASPSLSHNLQDLALLDLGTPQSTPGGNFGSSPFKSEVLHTQSPCVGASSFTSNPVLIGGPNTSSSTATCQADSPLLHALHPITPVCQPSSALIEEASLANVFVPLDAIKPSKVCPVTAYDKSGIRVLLHFASDCPPGRPEVLVMVASMLNTAPLPVSNIALQAAVPKTMKVRLQPPSGTELAPFNPVLPPAAITQVMLLANPLKENVRMRYKLTFTLGVQAHTEVGEVNEFPPADRWGSL